MVTKVVLAVSALLALWVVIRDIRKGSRKLSESEKDAVGKIGFEGKNFYGPAAPSFRCRDLRSSDLLATGIEKIYVVASYGCTAGGTLIWGGCGRRFYFYFEDGSIKLVPHYIYEEQCGTSRLPMRQEGNSLQSELDSLDSQQRSRLRYILLEEWDETERAVSQRITVLRLSEDDFSSRLQKVA